MNSKLVQLAVDLSFEKMVYTGKRRFLVNGLMLLALASLVLTFLCVIDRNKSPYYIREISSFLIFLTLMGLLWKVGDNSTRKILGTPFGQFKERSKAYRHLAKLQIWSRFESEEFEDLSYRKAIKLLKKEQEQITSTYKQILYIFVVLSSVVWYHFVAKLFSLRMFDQIDRLMYLFFTLIFFAALITLFRFLMKDIVVLTTKLSKMENLIQLLEEVKNESQYKKRKKKQ